MSDNAGLNSTIKLPSYRPAQVEKIAPCQLNCASGSDVRGWIGTISQRRKTGLSDFEAFEKAWRILTDANPFPAVMGRICPHPCESACNRTEKDGHVAINALERFLGDWAIKEGLSFERVDEGERPAESVGVIGAGPSGLSFAYQMARLGYPVVVYEQHSSPGGMLRYGVPDYRLPPAVVDAEINRLVELGVQLKLGVSVGTDITIDELKRAHDYVYVGIGAQAGRMLGLAEENEGGVLTGIEYLARANRGEQFDVGRRVVVVGGGNTAIDAARTARRAGADVTILYRRTRAEMPAIPSEVTDAIAEGVTIEFLGTPVGVVRAGGAVTKVVAQRIELGEAGSDGRPQPSPIPGSEFEIPADTVIAAVSQEPDSTVLDHLGLSGMIPRSPTAMVGDRLIAGGDVLRPDTAGAAINQGRLAAMALHRRLRGLPEPSPEGRRRIGSEEIRLAWKADADLAVADRLTVTQALSNPSAEIARPLTEEAFLAEVERCFSCGQCMGCSACWMYCTVGSFIPATDPSSGHFFLMDLVQCEECGKCIEVCPAGFLEAVPT